MGFLDRLLRRTPAPTIAINTLRPPRPAVEPRTDAAAVERYRYLLRTAPPDDLERAHAKAFERLTPDQRDIVRRDLEATVPAAEAPRSSDPQDLARVATRAEARAPGTIERAFRAGTPAPGMADSFLQTFAAVFVATSVAQALFGGFGYPYTSGQGVGDPSTEDGSTRWPATDPGAVVSGEADAGGVAEAGDLDTLGGFGDVTDFGDFGGFDI